VNSNIIAHVNATEEEKFEENISE